MPISQKKLAGIQLENTLSILRLAGNSKTIPTTFYCNSVDPTSAQQTFQLQFICRFNVARIKLGET